MSHTKSYGAKGPQPITRTGEGHFRTKVEDLPVEEILKRANIQSNILDLQSKDEGKVKSALNTLSSITRFTDRKDALYVLVGYYKIEIKSMDGIIDFFNRTEMAYSIDLSVMILSDLIRFKDISRRRLFVHEFLIHLSLVLRPICDNRKKEIRTLIEISSWGDKLKRKFLDKLFYHEF